MRDRVIGKIPMLVGFSIEDAEVRGDRVNLKLRGADGNVRELVTEHVIAATGYKPDLRRFHFLAPELRAKPKAVNGTPILSSSMESSVPGLYFAGTITANSFGPVMRFAFGAEFSAARLSRALT